MHSNYRIILQVRKKQTFALNSTLLKVKSMVVITSKEFRDKHRKYFRMAKMGEDVVVKSRENDHFKLVPVSEPVETVIRKEFILFRLQKEQTYPMVSFLQSI